VVLAAPAAFATWKHTKRVVIATIAVLAVAAFFAARNPMFRRLALDDRTANLNGYTLELATPEMRFDLYKRALRMARDHAIVGVGLGNFQGVFESVYNPQVNNDGTRGVHAHNLWLQAYAELGIAGGTAYVLLWAAAIFAAWRNSRRHPDFASFGVLLALIALGVSNLTTNLFFLPGLVSARLHSIQWVLFAFAATDSDEAATPPASSIG
jgi:O-antigen ligase